jgi:hypothetical protein
LVISVLNVLIVVCMAPSACCLNVSIASIV